jgi:glutamate-1-semialdehyde 2,1-aminomutase
VANGYPLGVLGGRREIMDRFDAADPKQRVLIAGTYNAHPIAVAAALATLKRLSDDQGAVYRQLEALGARLERGLDAIFREKGIVARTSRIGSAFCTYFCDHIPVDWHDIAMHHDVELDRRYRRGLVDRGVYHFPLPCKQGSISAAHDESLIDRTLEVTRQVVRAL